MRILKLIILSLICQLSFAKTPVELLTPIDGKEGLQAIEGKYLDDRKQVIHVRGTSRVKKMRGSNKRLIRVVLTEVDKPGKNVAKYFAKPVMMTFSAPEVKKGAKLNFKTEDLQRAIKNLKKIKKQVKLKDRYSSSRNILEPKQEIKSNNAPLGTSTNSIDGASTIIEEGDDINGKSSTNEMGQNGKLTYGNGKSVGSRVVGNPNTRRFARPTTVRDVVDRGNIVHAGSKNTSGNNGSEFLGKNSENTTKDDRDDPLYSKFEDVKAKDRDSNKNNGGSSQNGLGGNDSSNDESSFFDDEEFSSSLFGRNRFNSSNYDSLFDDYDGGDMDFSSSSGNSKSSPKNSKSNNTRKKYEEDDTRVEITTNGCPIKPDYANDRVIIQNKAITYKGDVIVKQTECSESLEHYAIKKDYLCDRCKDHIDLSSMKAYPTFEYFWTNKSSTKKILSSQPEIDKTQAFPIITEKGDCEPLVKIKEMKAYPQKELVYYDRVNARQVAKTCHVDSKQSPATIAWTMDGCTPTHDYQKSWTLVNKRAVYTIDDKEFTAVGCKHIGLPIKHEWDYGVCTNDVSVTNSRAVVKGRRFVVIEGDKTYLGECEPTDGEQLLMETIEGCENQYVHSKEEQRSYLKKRWYFLDHLDKQFVTACIKSTEYLPHKVEVTGYENDDGNKKAKQITTVYIIDKANKRIDLYKDYINPRVEPIPYELVETKSEPTDSAAFQGCFKITQTNNYKYWRRPNKSVLKQFCGIGKPIKSGDLCKRVTEKQNQFHMTTVTGTKRTTAKLKWVQIDLHDEHFHIFPVRTNPNRSCPGRLYSSGGSLGGYGAPVAMQPMLKYLWNGFNLKRVNVYKKNERLKTTYPNGHVQYTKWHHTGEYHKTGEVQACFNWREWKRDNNLGNSYIAMRKDC